MVNLDSRLRKGKSKANPAKKKGRAVEGEAEEKSDTEERSSAEEQSGSDEEIVILLYLN